MIPVSFVTEDVPVMDDEILPRCPKCNQIERWNRRTEITDDGTPHITGGCDNCHFVAARATDWGGKLTIIIGEANERNE